MIAIEGIPRSMYHGPMLANYGQGFPGGPSLNGDLQRPGFYFGEQKVPGIPQPSALSTAAAETDKSKQHQQQQQQQHQQQHQQQQWKDALKQRKEYSTLKKVILVLQDNRLKTGDPKTAEKLREFNRSQNESCPLLKTILNVLLVSTAVVLLVAVIVVIIYTSVRSPAQLTTDDGHLERPEEEEEAAAALESSPPASSSSSSGRRDDEQPETAGQRESAAEFKPRTRVKTSTSIRCRMIPMVTHGDAGGGAGSSINLRELCFETSSDDETSL